MKVLIILTNILIFELITCSIISNQTILNNQNKRSAKLIKKSSLWIDPCEDENGVWSKLLEDYTLSQSSNRMSRMEGQQRYIPTSDFYISRRTDEIELDALKRPPATSLQSSGNFKQFGNFQNNQHGNYQNNFHGGNNYQQNMQPNRQGGGSTFPPNQRLREVSETDLYLLGAIEKLVYRVDYIENRLRRSEQLIYYLMAGNNEHKKELLSDPCPKNFTKIGDNCYHIGGDRQLNWKSASLQCKSMSGHLAEFTSISENEEIVAYLLNHPGHRSKDFWLGGLNPGLLWIWSNSAKPVNPNTDLNSLTQTAAQQQQNQQNNSTSNENTKTSSNGQIKVLNNTLEIKGSGRCLRLSYNPAKHSYYYYGQECTSRHNFICEFDDRTLDNQIKKIGRSLKLF